MATSAPTKKVVELAAATVRFCGDSGDGMQLAGTQLTNTSALAGNDIATFPDFPAEIRAPRGTKAGVSGFQIRFASNEIFTPGDQVDALVAMNPAALVDQPGRPGAGRHPDRQQGRLRRKGHGPGRLQDQSARRRQPGRLSAVSGRDDPAHAAGRRRAWAWARRKPTAAATSTRWAWSSGCTIARSIRRCATSTKSSARCPAVAEANRRALKAGYNYGETTEAMASQFRSTRPSCRRACTATSRATRPRPGA